MQFITTDKNKGMKTMKCVTQMDSTKSRYYFVLRKGLFENEERAHISNGNHDLILFILRKQSFHFISQPLPQSDQFLFAIAFSYLL